MTCQVASSSKRLTAAYGFCEFLAAVRAAVASAFHEARRTPAAYIYLTAQALFFSAAAAASRLLFFPFLACAALAALAVSAVFFAAVSARFFFALSWVSNSPAARLPRAAVL